MNAAVPFLDQLAGPAGLRLSLALVHFLWQGVLIAALAAVALRVIGRRSSRRRYTIAVASLALMAAAPVVTFCLVTPPEPLIAIEPLAEVELVVALEQFPPLTSFPEVEPLPTTPAPLTWPERLRHWQPYALLLWLLGTGFFAVRVGIGTQAVWWFGRNRQPLPDEWLETATHVAERLGIRLPRIHVSGSVVEAVAVGLFKPMVLLPAAWIGQVPLDVLEAVLAHEMAHLRRHDLWVNLLQRLVEAALFYHPAVWWLSRRVRIEREYCCDETAALVVCGRAAYARALEFVATERVARKRPATLTTALAAGIGGDEMELLNRVCRILDADLRPRRGNWLSEALLALALPAALWAAVATIGPESVKADDADGKQAAAGNEEAEEAPEPTVSEPAPNPGTAGRQDAELQKTLRELREEMQTLREEVAELRRNEKERVIRALNQSVTLQLDDAPLHEAIQELAERTGIRFLIDESGLSKAGVKRDQRISISIKGVSARHALDRILDSVQLGSFVEDGVVKVTNRKRIPIVITYPIADLLVPEQHQLSAIEAEALIFQITGTIEPQSWEEFGGHGIIRLNETTLSLIVRQSQDVHDKIAALLERIRSEQREKTNPINRRHKNDDKSALSVGQTHPPAVPVPNHSDSTASAGEHRIVHDNRTVTWQVGPDHDLLEVEIRPLGASKFDKDVKDIVQILAATFGRNRPVWAKDWQRKTLGDGNVELEITLFNGSTPTFLLSEHEGGVRLKPLRRFFLSDGSKPFIPQNPQWATGPEQQVQSALDRTVSLSLDNVPLREALRTLIRQADVNFAIDPSGLQEVGLTADEPVSYELEQVSLRSALKVLLTPLNLAYVVDNDLGIIIVTSRNTAKGPLEVQTYSVGDLIADDAGDAEAGLAADALIDLITGTVEPDSWSQVGGNGVIRLNKATASLVIRQPRGVHDQVAEFLEQMRSQSKRTNPTNREHKNAVKPEQPAGQPTVVLEGSPGEVVTSRAATLLIDGKPVKVVIKEYRDPNATGPAKKIELEIPKPAEEGAKVLPNPPLRPIFN